MVVWNTKKLFFTIASASAAGIVIAGIVRTSAFAVLVPFVIAYAAARTVRPLGLFFSRMAKVKETVGCAVWAVLICLAAGVAVTSLSGAAWDKLEEAAVHIPEAAETAVNMLSGITEKIGEHLPFLQSGSSEFGGVVKRAFGEAAAGLGSAAADTVRNAVSVFPGSMFSLFIGLAAFVYLTADMDGIGASISALAGWIIGEKRAERLADTCRRFADALFQYLRSYLLLTFITFAELSAGFLVIGLESPFAAAFGTALVDALPFFGCGVIIVPWALWCFASGNVRRGVMLVILQAVITTVRQFAEPKIIGQMTGVHPFVVLALLFAGLKIGGIAGMVSAPIVLIAAVGMKDRNGGNEHKKSMPH